MNKMKMPLVIVLFFTLSVVLIACSGNDNTTSSADSSDGIMEVDVGLVPGASGAYVFEYMKQNKLFEEYAADFGYELKVNYNGFAGAPPQIEQMIAGSLDFGYVGLVPVSQAILKGNEITLLANPEGGMNKTVSVRSDSEINSVDELKGKTIGTFVGGDQEFFLTRVLQANFGGSGNPSEYNIDVVNLSSPTQMVDIPKGIDAVTTFYPQYLKGEKSGKLKMLASNEGDTEVYDQEQVPFFEKAQFYPESFFLHRPPLIARTGIVEEHPDLVTAYLMAVQKTIDDMKLGDKTAKSMAELVKGPNYWNLDPELGAKAIEDTLVYERGWIWFAEGDIQGSAKTLKIMEDIGMVDEALTFEDLKENIKPAVPAIKKAYDTLESSVEEEEFLREDLDIRGLPVWEMDKWE